MSSRKRRLIIAVIAVVLVWAAVIVVVWSRTNVRNAAKRGIQEIPFWLRPECREARQTVKEEVRRIRAAGEPTTLAEIVPPSVPEEENAAVLYEKAFEALDLSADDKHALRDLSGHRAVWPYGLRY